MNQQSPYLPPSEVEPQNAAADVPAGSRAAKRAGKILGRSSLLCAVAFVCWAFWMTRGVSGFAITIFGLIAAPYLILWLGCRTLTTWIALFLIALTLVGCVWLGIDAFDAVSDDAQGGLNLIFTPLFQIGGTFAVMCLAVTVDWVVRKLSAQR
ncbi:hypothetical protein [Rubripirellula lacrimiformis]|uniref:hypothetical protein n=1 Tax=Rubripirellula lacrimiformis TaxID=1930273 RepID=UPI001FEB9FC4|nr:hypothetical protein [Rubripirellula lacrimiformis]